MDSVIVRRGEIVAYQRYIQGSPGGIPLSLLHINNLTRFRMSKQASAQESRRLTANASSSMSLKVTSQETKKSSVFWRNLSQGGVKERPWAITFMQFGVFVDANRSFQFTLFDRLCVTAPCHGDPVVQAWDEKIFTLNQRQGKHMLPYPHLCLLWLQCR